MKGSERAGRMAMSQHRELPFRTKRYVGQSALRQAMIFPLQYERRNSGRKNADFFQEKTIGMMPTGPHYARSSACFKCSSEVLPPEQTKPTFCPANSSRR